MSDSQLKRFTIAGAAVLAIGALGYACAPSGKAEHHESARGRRASRVYVAPGSYDEFYSFMSGGYSGQVTVYGLPSGRLLKVDPGLLAVPEERLRLQRRDEADAPDDVRLRAVGRLAPSRAVA